MSEQSSSTEGRLATLEAELVQLRQMVSRMGGPGSSVGGQPRSEMTIGGPLERKFKDFENTISGIHEKLSDVEQNRGSRFPSGFLEGVKFIGKITAAGADANHWKWKFVVVNNSNGSQTDGNSAETAFGECVIAGGGSGAVGMTGLMILQARSNAGVAITMVPASSAVVFPVRLTKDGGVAGSNTTTCNLTYTCTSLANQSIPNGSSNTTTLQTPEHNWRASNVTYSIPSNGSIGTACYDNASPPVLHLLYVPEKPSNTQC